MSRDFRLDQVSERRQAIRVPDGTQSSQDFMEVQPRYRENECLDSVSRKQEVREYLESVSGHDLRPAQIEATYQLLYGEHDVLLQAATGYGKSIIWQLTGLLSQQLICPSTVL